VGCCGRGAPAALSLEVAADGPAALHPSAAANDCLAARGSQVEKEILQDTVKYYSAALALKSLEPSGKEEK